MRGFVGHRRRVRDTDSIPEVKRGIDLNSRDISLEKLTGTYRHFLDPLSRELWEQRKLQSRVRLELIQGHLTVKNK